MPDSAAPSGAAAAAVDGDSVVGPYGSTALASSNQQEDTNSALTSSYRLHDSDDDGVGVSTNPNVPEGGEDDDEDDDDEYDMSLTELLYSTSSYHAIAKPVSFTMILAALSVIFINTEDTIRQGEQQMAAAYTVWKVDDGSNGDGSGSASENLIKSLGNSLIIVTVICMMTFVIVLLYKFRFMKCLIGYMIFSSAGLLGVLGGSMFDVAIDKYRIPIDKFSFVFALYNFAIVGVIAIFFQQGVPTYITQGYLVFTSVILAWQFSHFDEWTTWTLLVMLALYDLCAVLTPCGPLKALVHLMSQDGSPEMPGLLYEAELPSGAQRPGGRSNQGTGSSSGAREEANGRQGGDGGDDGGSDRAVGTTVQGLESGASTRGTIAANRAVSHGTSDGGNAAAVPSGPGRRNKDSSSRSRPQEGEVAATEAAAAATTSRASDSGDVELSASAYTPPTTNGEYSPDSDVSVEPTAVMPLAIARLYKLRLVSAPPAPSSSGPPSTPLSNISREGSTVSTSPLLQDGDGTPSPNAATSQSYNPDQLRSDVEAYLPRNGGRITKKHGHDGKPRYIVTDRNGAVKRILIVNSRGMVFEELQDDDDSEDGGRGQLANSIKLGLGDFIFYSVLVAKAALYSFTTFAACMLVILAGLGGTLVLLSVYHQALPALPISIFLGVVFYLLTRLIIEPFIQDLLRLPYYV